MVWYIEAERISEIPRNNMKLFDVGTLKILIINVEGKFYAVENRCPHMGYPLFFGSLEGKVLKCGFHNAQFDVSTGKPLNGVTGKSLRTFTLLRRGSRIIMK